jgi:CDP-glucose 4,6-dehydratase
MFEKLKKSGKPIVVTGATGFKGTWLCKLLDALDIDYLGIGLDDRSSHYYTTDRLDNRISIVNMTDFYELKKFLLDINPNLIIHMAASSLVLESYKSPFAIFSNNFNSSLNLLEIVNEHLHETKILITTTDKVYKPVASHKKFIESDQIWGQDPYSHSKVCVEALANAYQNLSSTSKIPSIYVARAGNVIGGGDINKNRLFSELGLAIITGEKVAIRNPYHTRPFQHVLDVLIGYLYYVEAIAAGKVIPLALNFANKEDSLTVQEATTIFGLSKSSTIFKTKTSDSKKENPMLDISSNLTRNTIGWSNMMSSTDAIRLTREWWETVKLDPVSSLNVTEKNIKDYLTQINFNFKF